MNHSFNIEVAKKYGIVPAILLENLYWWIEKNTANGRHYFDGHNWTYNSAKAFERQFPYLTRRQIGYALKSLEDNGLIITGDYNENRCLRTKWYAITKEGYSILQNCQMQVTNLSNASTGIYIINTSSCTDINETDINTPINAPTENDKTASDDAAPAAPKGGVSETIKTVISYLNEKTGKRFSPKSAMAVRHITARLKEGYALEDFKAVIDKKVAAWKGDERMAQYLRPETLFGSKFDGYLNEVTAPKSYKAVKSETYDYAEWERTHDEFGNPIGDTR